MLVGKSVDKRQAQARAASRVCRVGRDLFKWLAQARQVLGRNADAVVDRPRCDDPVGFARARTVTVPPESVNLTALDSRLSRICFSARRSPSSVRSPAGRSVSSMTPALVRVPRSKPRAVVRRCRRRSTSLDMEFEFSGLDLGHVEDVGDQVEQQLAGFVDQSGIFVIARCAEGAEHVSGA